MNIGKLSVSLIAASLFLGSAALAQEPAARGRALLEDNCGRCHAIDKTGDSPRAGALAFRTLGRSFEMDGFAAKLQGGLMSGHPDMPEFKFNEDDARAVATYLRSIQE
jgi:cytochrome c